MAVVLLDACGASSPCLHTGAVLVHAMLLMQVALHASGSSVSAASWCCLGLTGGCRKDGVPVLHVQSHELLAVLKAAN